MEKQEKQYTKTYVHRLRAKINTLETLIQKYDSIAKKYNTENKNTSNNKERRNFWINVVLAVSTVIIATFAVFQYISFEKFSKKNSRAYLVVVNPVLDTLEAYGRRTPRVTYTIQNTGKTPAYKVTSFIFLKNNGKVSAQ